MRTAKEIINYFANKGFKPNQFKSLSALGVRAFYKREELNYSPSMLTEDEFIALYTVHASNLSDEKELLTENQLKNGLNSGWVAAVSMLSSGWSYPQRNYRVGHQVILVPIPYTSTSGILKVEPGYKPKPEEIAIITDEAVIPFHGYDENGTAFPFGVDFIVLFNVGKDIPTSR